jgi:non-specific serine/threonine protein kinase/serine/threonine-protein kinase
MIQKLGEGGMGEVWEAEQLEPIRRRVALKVVKWGMDTREVIARFESERQALALMNHPSIARVYDAGATEQGSPYFAMELISAMPINGYCDRHKLGTRERLKLVSQVCEGVQHAHQKGIIHRDLKPSNVLVAVQDNNALPKIIDFGVAKATSQPLTEASVYTQHGQLIGTPEYMSPEQAEMTGLDIDTRSDIYSLGVILYELLTGTLPFNPKELRRSSLAEIQRKIRDEDPPKPSTQFSRLDRESSLRVATSRNSDPATLVRRLKGDLDWIIMKALEKDRTRRYETANALALDIERYLNDEPVRARPPATSYRMRKFIRRHRVGVTAASLVLLALVLGIAGTIVGLLRTRRAEVAARTEAQTAAQVSGFLVDLFRVSDPSEARGNSVTAREILSKGAVRIRTDLQGQPEVQARLMHTIGKVYAELGLYQEARSLLEEAASTRERIGGESAELAETLTALGELSSSQGQYDQAIPLLQRSISLRERILGPEHLAVAQSLNSLANVYRQQGKYAEAIPLLQQSLKIREQSFGANHPEVATTASVLGAVYAEQGKYAEAEPIFQRALVIREQAQGVDHPDVAKELNNLANINYEQGKHAEAERLYVRALAINEKVYGPDHVNVARNLYNLANVYGDLRRPNDAIKLYQRALSIWEKALGPDNPYVAAGLSGLGSAWEASEKYPEAGPALERALTIREKTLTPDHPFIATAAHNLGNFYRKVKRYSEAETLLLRSLKIREKSLEPTSQYFAYSYRALANLYRDTGRYNEAESLYERALKQWETARGTHDQEWRDLMHDFAQLRHRQGRSAEAAALEERAKNE